MLLIDRLLFRSFLKAWLVCFISLVSLYVVIDLFNKLDEFVDAAHKTGIGLTMTLLNYYGIQGVLIFDRLCGVIVLLAAMFTVAWLQRNNELLPLLSAGVSTRRVLFPILWGTLLMVGLSVANRELLIPLVGDVLERPANDPNGEDAMEVHGTFEPNGTLITGQSAFRNDLRITRFACTFSQPAAGGLAQITAEEAKYEARPDGKYVGRWLLLGTPKDVPAAIQRAGVETIEGKLFLRVERVDFASLTRRRSWHQFASTMEIFEALADVDSNRLAATAVQLHLRLTVPLLTIIMVGTGMALLLRDQQRGVFVKAATCLILAGSLYLVAYAARHLGEQEYLAPPLAAWLPVLLFGPICLVLLDAIQT